MDLAQAEAVADLIDASSTKAAQAALGSLRGLFSKQVNSLAEELVSLRLLVEATLDFPEEEIDFLQQSDAKERLQRCHDQLVRLHQTGRNSLKLSAGLRLVLVGEPNVGKSSLLNALSGEDRAIVTPIAGTTRDAIHVDIELNGLRVTLIDTAGLRDTDDPVERLGIERTLGEIAQADLLLQLEEAGHAQFAHTAAIANSGRLAFSYDGPRLRVINKSDLLSSVPGAPCANAAAVWVSAKTGQGLEELKQRIFELAQCDPDDDFPFLARERHLLALQACLQHVVQAVIHADQGDLCLDLFAEELRLAHDNLGEITGRVLPDDLLGLIFSRFCIGK
jgi:tRNA modification GTPase